MTTRPINLSDWQVRAALDGRLSLVVEPVKISGYRRFSEFGPSDTPGYDWHFRDAVKRWNDLTPFELESRLQRHRGDRLWVREAWETDRYYDDLSPSEMGGEEPLFYACDCTVQRWGGKPDALSRWGRGRPSTHMPRWASRLTLIVTDVKVMRVQEVALGNICKCGMASSIYDFKPVQRAFEAFSYAWNASHAKHGLGWDANPWVTATTVTVHRENIDKMEAGE